MCSNFAWCGLPVPKHLIFYSKFMFLSPNSNQLGYRIDLILLLWKIPYSISQSWETYHVFPPCQFWNELQIRKYGLGQFHNEKFNCNRQNTTITSVLPTKILICWGHLKLVEGLDISKCIELWFEHCTFDECRNVLSLCNIWCSEIFCQIMSEVSSIMDECTVM